MALRGARGTTTDRRIDQGNAVPGQGQRDAAAGIRPDCRQVNDPARARAANDAVVAERHRFQDRSRRQAGQDRLHLSGDGGGGRRPCRALVDEPLNACGVEVAHDHLVASG